MNRIYLITVIIVLRLFQINEASAQTDSVAKFLNGTEITARAENEKYQWIGTNQGLYFIRKKNGQVHHISCKNSVLLSDSITCIVTKPDGETYIGTKKGIIRYDNFAFLPITTENSSLRCNCITSLVCINDREILAGTASGGITIFNGANSRTISSQNSYLSCNHITALEKIGPDSIAVLMQNKDRLILCRDHNRLCLK